ncbi:hypothetical protein T4E_2102 [Trichinella pseudospiralis]|uniref:Uncharacterized protein n=1 Tax=Trichinella pseudospiralis TaxID=6337 RepID=A0A0V0YBC2_TRIPS|nr:hypothetical protein T4E_2102 [Trichinella pseudospiralis]
MINSSRGQFSPTKRCSQALLGRFGINQENISTGNKQQTTHCGCDAMRDDRFYMGEYSRASFDDGWLCNSNDDEIERNTTDKAQ